MIRQGFFMIAVGAMLVAAATPVGASDPLFMATGSFTVGSPVAYSIIDACGNGGMTEGVDSTCVALDGEYGGRPYALTGGAEVGDAAFSVCFYQKGTLSGCDPDVVPAGADAFSVSALGGVDVEWTLIIT